MAPSRDMAPDTSKPRTTREESRAQEQTEPRQSFGCTLSEMWPDAPFTTSGLDLEAYKTDVQPQLHTAAPCHRAAVDLPAPSQLKEYSDSRESRIRCNPYHFAAWYQHTEQKERQGCRGEGWSQTSGPTRAPSAPMSAFQAYSMAPMHQRYASESSTFCSDDRQMLASDPGSDLSSDYSDLFQPSGLPFSPVYPADTSAELGHSCTTTFSDAHQMPLPAYVVDELKRLKLENMALRRMAQEVVRVNTCPDSLDIGRTDRPVAGCAHHAPLTSPPRLQRVLEGAEPVQVYLESTSSIAPETPAARGQGTAASMWAPRQSASTPSATSAKPFRASEISAEELRRRVATVGVDPSPLPGHQSLAGSDSPLDPTAGSLAAQLRSKPFASTPSRASPLPASVTASRLENAPASTLIGMILDRRGQEASLLLQQQLKSGSAERQDEIHQAICARIVPLSHDRHGNFLVQTAIEDRAETAMHLRGAFVELTMSQFGCHVVQKALEGEEGVREAVTEELLGSRLDQTLTSRHSIHVWQRILETDWKRPQFREQIFASINRQLKGRWARTARQETGSIICQNIFESAQPGEKAQCMQEVLEELDECATNQWGVWVVQHIIEHGAEEERKAALRGLVRSASKLTLSQFGQKAVMSGLKTGDRHFLQEYVEAMCQASQPRRPPLIDVCLAPHGIQIVTQLLTTVDQKTRERIISTVRRNSVFLKGSKAGMKVHQLCERARAFAGY